MASEYLKWKYKDVKRTEQRELTPAEKRKNWWYYHRWYVLAAVIAAAALGRFTWDQLHRVTPDCTVALVVRFVPSSQETAALQAALEEVCPDSNGDGTSVVDVNVIQLDYAAIEAGTMDPQVAASNLEKLNADFYTRRSGLFLLDDPAAFQAANGALAARDGSLPPEGADWTGLTVSWTDCALGAEHPLPPEWGELWLGRRVAVSPEDQRALAGAAALWERLTAGEP